VPRGFGAIDEVAGRRDEVEVAQRERPEAKIVRLRRQMFELDREWARNQMLPRLDVSAQAAKGLVPYMDYLDEIAVGVKFQYFLGQEVARGHEEVADAELLRIKAEERLVLDAIEAEVLAARVNLEVAAQQVRLVGIELDVARQVEAAERDRFEQGDSTLLMVNLREQATADAENKLIDTYAAYERAMAVYRAALGQLR
jgi:outer membrane protein TolC